MAKGSIQIIRNLNDLGKGVDKRWPLKSSFDYELAHDYLQKVNYSLQDLNAIIEKGLPIKQRGDYVFAVVLVDWIYDAVSKFQDCYREGVISGFRFSEQDWLNQGRKYLKALRSFVAAHPLATSRHKEYGLNGALVCVDIRSKSATLDLSAPPFLEMDLLGMKEIGSIKESDVVLYVYSKQDGAKFFRYVAVHLNDLVTVASLCVDALYELDRYLAQCRKKDFLSE